MSTRRAVLAVRKRSRSSSVDARRAQRAPLSGIVCCSVQALRNPSASNQAKSATAAIDVDLFVERLGTDPV
jgi:hypothetical protein